MKRLFWIVPMIAILSLVGCDATGGLTDDEVAISDDVALKGGKAHGTYAMDWPLPDMYAPCLDETVSFTGYAVLEAFYQLTPSGNYIDMAHFDFETDEPYVMYLSDGTALPLLRGEDNSLYLVKGSGNNIGTVTAQANMTFGNEDGSIRIKWRNMFIADGFDENGFVNLRVSQDKWVCKLPN